MCLNLPLIAKSASLTDEDDLDLKASISSSALDFDFLQGHHSVYHRKLKERLSGCTEWIDIEGLKMTEKILGGIGNVEKHYFNQPEGKPFEVVALRLFNPSTRLWSVYWADSHSGTLDPPLQGSFDGNLGVFFGIDYHLGEEVLVQFQYDRTNRKEPIWGQAFSNDQGVTSEWNWFMFYKKRDASRLFMIDVAKSSCIFVLKNCKQSKRLSQTSR